MLADPLSFSLLLFLSIFLLYIYILSYLALTFFRRSCLSPLPLALSFFQISLALCLSLCLWLTRAGAISIWAAKWTEMQKRERWGISLFRSSLCLYRSVSLSLYQPFLSVSFACFVPGGAVEGRAAYFD